MKRTLTLLFLTFLFAYAGAKHIDEATARLVAKNFLTTRTNSSKLQSAADNLSLAYTATSQGNMLPAALPVTDYFYVFNVGTSGGFVIISADDNVIPVLGYSDQKPFDPNHMARTAVKWLDNYKSQIRYVIDNNISQTDDIKKRWDALNTNSPKPVLRSLTAVNPLVQTTWDQPFPYNTSCPYDATAGQNCVTGCPATAMAQILKYWSYPTQGNGIHSYSCANYGTLTANFGSTTYNWGNMPNSISAQNNDIANLMFQCGVAVEMNYGVQESSGFVITADNPVCCQSAYTTYFGYDAAAIQGLQRVNYTDQAWITLLENELTANRPVQYAGFGSGGGHTWVCDGFDANNLFHMNWGWSGADDGFYDVNVLNPSSLGTGGGTGGFNSGEEALIGIKPISGGGTSTGMSMNSVITITPNPIGFAQAFSVNADLINNGTANFSGDYCAALFDASGTFISYIGNILTTGSSPLQPGYHYTGGLTFSDTLGQLLAVPGTYTVGIYYAPSGGSWYLAATNSYTNPVSVTISGPINGIELNSNIVATPAQFVQGQPASVNLNLLNNTSTTFIGQYGVALYDLAGNYVQTIGTYNESSGLQGGYTYNSPYLTFSTSSITAAPGTYILGVLEEQTGTNTPYLVGGSTYTNPINITVVAAPLQPDIYEADNTVATAHVFPLNYSGNYAYLSTAGSNIHNASDLDYYQVNLPAGMYYTFQGQIDNSAYTANSNTYTLDGVASYSTDGGSTWSSAFNGIIPTFTVSGGGSVIFLAAPYFPGQTGTYLLEMNVTRSLTGIQNISATDALVSIYPNPATNMVTITSDGQPVTISIYDITGKLVLSKQMNGTTNTLDASDISKGIYVVKAQQGDKTSCQKLIVN